MFTQRSIKIFHSVQEIRPVSLFQNLALGEASTDDKCYFATVAPFSEYKPRQKLNQSQVSFDSLMGYILSISMGMQNFITIFHSVQKIAPLSLFLEFGARQSLDQWKNVISQSLGLDLININVYATVYQNIPLSLRDGAIFTFSEYGARLMINVIFHFLELDLVNINVSAKFYQNIPNGLRVKFHCFQNLKLGKPSTNPKCHLTISWATSCQYQYVCKVSSQYSTPFGHFHFFRIWSSAQSHPMLNVILQSFGLDLAIPPSISC